MYWAGTFSGVKNGWVDKLHKKCEEWSWEISETNMVESVSPSEESRSSSSADLIRSKSVEDIPKHIKEVSILSIKFKNIKVLLILFYNVKYKLIYSLE